MKTILQILLFFTSSSTFSQTQIIENFNTIETGYELYINYYGGVISDSTKARSNILNNPEKIKALVQDWQGEKVNYVAKCGFDYTIYLVKDKKIIEQIAYNSECNFVRTENSNFKTTTNPFLSVEKDSTFKNYEFYTDNYKEARYVLNKALEFKNIYIPHLKSYDKWRTYENSFTIHIKEKSKSKKLKQAEVYQKEIHDKYPLDNFEIDYLWNYNDTTVININCHPGFWEKFTLYEKKKNGPIESLFFITFLGDKYEIGQIEKIKYEAIKQ
jgi:hypothetical protein